MQITYTETDGRRTIVDTGVASGYVERRKYDSDWLQAGFYGDRRVADRRNEG